MGAGQMLVTPSIVQIATDTATVHAFRIRAEIGADDLQAMGAAMNRAFDRHPSVSMLLIFETYDGVEGGAGLDLETLSANVRALASVDRYAVVGAPAAAARLIEMMDKIIPTRARTFDTADAPAAWAFVGARPLGDPPQATTDEHLRPQPGVIDQRQQQTDPASHTRRDPNEAAKRSQKQPGQSLRDPQGSPGDGQ